MTKRSRRAPLWLAVALAAGCGDDGGDGDGEGGGDAGVTECADPAAHTPADGPYASPADFDLAACQPGSFADFDPSGLWYMDEEGQSFFSGGGPVRFDLGCEDGLTVEPSSFLGAEPVADRALSADHLFWRRERRFDSGAFVIVDAYLLCQRSDGALAGTAAHCFLDGGEEQCGTGAIELRPFGRVEGESEAEGLELVSEFSGAPGSPWPEAFTANVRVQDGVAFVVRGRDGLRVVDVSDPEAPREISWLELPEDDLNDIKLVSVGETRYALLGSNSRGLLVAEVTDPAQPELVAVVSPSGEPAHGVHTIFTEVIDDVTYAYLADGFTHVVTIWDVSDPAEPVKVGSYAGPSEDFHVHDLYVEGGRMYLNATLGGLIIVDTQPDPASPELVGRFVAAEPTYSHSSWVVRAGGRTVAITGGEGYGSHYRVVDVDPDSPEFLQELGSYQTRPQVSAHNVMAAGGTRAYAAYYQDGVRVLDLSDPSAPSLAAYYNTWSPDTALGARFEGAVGLDLDPEAELIYVADQPRGLLILREID